MSKAKIDLSTPKAKVELFLPEAMVLKIILAGVLTNLEEDYRKNKKDKSYPKEDTLTEINLLKGLLDKITQFETKLLKGLLQT